MLLALRATRPPRWSPWTASAMHLLNRAFRVRLFEIDSFAGLLSEVGFFSWMNMGGSLFFVRFSVKSSVSGPWGKLLEVHLCPWHVNSFEEIVPRKCGVGVGGGSRKSGLDNHGS
jgi:hypothetical protein